MITICIKNAKMLCKLCYINPKEMITKLLRNFTYFLISLSFLGSGFAQTLNPERAGFSSQGLDRIAQYFENEVANGNIPGAVSLIYRKGYIAQKTGIGMIG